MGNTCVGPTISWNGFIQSVSDAVWRSWYPDDSVHNNGETTDAASPREPESPLPVVPNKPPEQVVIPTETKTKQENTPPTKPNKKPQMKRVSSAGLMTESVLQRKTGNFKEFYILGRKLGQGQFGTTFLCLEKATGKAFACKSITKRKLLTEEDVDDVWSSVSEQRLGRRKHGMRK